MLVAGALVGGIAAAHDGSGAPAIASSDPTTSTARPAGEPVSIEWVGDMVLGSSFGLPPDGGKQSLANVTRTLQDADLTFGTLEETMSTTSGSKCLAGSSNCYAFQAPPPYATLLKRAGFDVVNQANNHAFDFGATVYQHLGSPLDAQWTNPQGRPIPVVTGEGRPIPELS